jgi:hypothetical protein
MNAERVYRPLLRSYPAAYRAERGEEIIDTVLEGGDRPHLREARSLLFGGLRARAAQNRRLPAATNWRLGILLGVVSWLASLATGGVVRLAQTVLHDVPAYEAPTSAQDWRNMAIGVLLLVVVGLTWFARARWVALVAATAGVVMSVSSPDNSWRGIQVVLIACALLARGPVRMPRIWLWVPAVFFAVHAVNTWSITITTEHWSAGLTLALEVVVMAWLAVDARPLLGLATFLFIGAGFAMVPFLFDGAFGEGWALLIVPAIGAVVLLPAAWRLRRQSAL